MAAKLDLKALRFLLGGCTIAVLTRALLNRLKRAAFAPLKDRDTGILRRKHAPPQVDISAEANFMDGCYEWEAATKNPLKNERSFLTLKDGKNIFYQTFEPQGETKVKGVLVIIHGYGDHCDFFNGVKAKAICNLADFAIVTFDLPGHGRSDGELLYIENWLGFVDSIREVLAEHLVPMARKKWGENLKVFGLGESMGGGVLFTLLAREKTLFDGGILVCPMLTVAPELLPPVIVLRILENILVPLLPNWPILKINDLTKTFFSDSSMTTWAESREYHKSLVYRAPARLRTLMECAFAAAAFFKVHVANFDVPTLLIHGDVDQATDPGGSQLLFSKMKHPDKKLIFPSGACHLDLLNGGPTCYKEVAGRYKELVDWLQMRA